MVLRSFALCCLVRLQQFAFAFVPFNTFNAKEEKPLKPFHFVPFDMEEIIFQVQKLLFQGSLLLRPPAKEAAGTSPSAALVFLPGCLLEPKQYDALASAIQQQSKQSLWIVIPKLPFDMANPLTVPLAVHHSIANLHKEGFDGKIFVGGHSLGGTFLSDVMKENG